MLWFVLLTVASTAYAPELAGVRLPDRVTVNEQTLLLNGLGLREATAFKVNVYVAGLYLEERTSRPEEILDLSQSVQIRMQYVRSVNRKDIADAWQEAFQKHAAIPLDDYRENLERFVSWMSGVSKGDTRTFTYLPQKQALQVETNGERRGILVGKNFALAFLRVWFGPDVPYKDLKNGLLGLRPSRRSQF